MSEKQEVQTAMRLAAELLERADKLAIAMSQPGMRVTRTEVLRMAVYRGVEALEAERVGKKTR